MDRMYCGLCYFLTGMQEAYPDFKNSEIRKAISAGLNFIPRATKAGRSWYGGWAVCFTYGYWFGVEAISKADGEGLL